MADQGLGCKTGDSEPSADQGLTGVFQNGLPIIATLTGSDTCIALGITVTDSAAVLVICRALIAARHDPASPLVAFRGGTPSLRVRSLGEAARLRVSPRGVGFVPAASPVRSPNREVEQPA